MSFFDIVEEEVRSFSAEGLTVRDFRLSLVSTTSASLGVESNRTGSPYAPLEVTELGGGGFLVLWSDGKVSKGSLSRAPREVLRESLRSALEGRYDDPDEANFPGEAEVPDVALSSPDAAAVAAGRSPKTLPETLKALFGVRERHGVKLLDASVSAVLLERRVVSSGGFRADSESTRFGFSMGYDSLVWDAHGSRDVPSIEAVVEQAERTAADYETLLNEAETRPTGATRILLHPRVAEQFLRTFLLSNLSGAAVANGRSRFGAGDFREGRRVFREDFSLDTRPLEPLSLGAYGFTDEGVPAREVALVRDGCLVTPALSLKHARRLEMEPAPVPAAIEGYRLSLDARRSCGEALAETGRVVLVHSAMGLHTQDAARGEYSVLAPQGTLYEDGVSKGRVSVTLNGSFFADLAGPDLGLVDFPGFSCPGLALTAELS